MARVVPRFRRRERIVTEASGEDALPTKQPRRFARRPGATRRQPAPRMDMEQRETSGMMEPTEQPQPARWEYCQLIFEGATERDGRWWSDLTIYYIGEPNRSAVLSSSDPAKGKSWATNTGPWRAALAGLGRGGWELVSVQHSGVLNPSEAIAYFKRPVEPGRPVNNPEISI
ncbi:MAG: hypothetical protein DCC58_10060 [Chloroflexi bacterium]|nr:MAG: hypothetical protein DCC58_10060 [Chloroflexota bacterium]